MSTVTPSRPPAPSPARSRPRRASGLAAARTIDPFRLLRRHLVLLVGVGMTGVFLGVVVYMLLDRFFPLFTGEVLFEIRAGLDEARAASSGDITQDDLVMRLATTESFLMTSREVLQATVKEPDVQLTSWFQNKFIDQVSGTALIDEAVDELEEKLGRKLVPGTNLFGAKWSSGVAGDVPIVLNTVARAYQNERKRIDDGIYNENLEVFRTSLRDTNRQLDDLNEQIQTFIREKGITSLDDPRSNQLALATSELVSRIADANSSLIFAQSSYLLMAAKLEGTIEPSDEDRRLAEDHPAARPHEYALLQAKTMRRQLRDRYTDPNHYLIQKAESAIRALDAEYEAKIQEVMADNLQAQLKSLDNQIKQAADMAEELEQEYQEKDALLRALAADMSLYLEMEDRRDYLAKNRDADLTLMNEVRLMRLREDAKRVRYAQRALTPREKSFPRIELVVPATTVIVVALVVGLIFLRELTDQRVKSASDLMVVPDARVVGVIPELEEDPIGCETAELVVRHQPNSVMAESYRQAAALINKEMQRVGHQTLLLVGGLPNAGTTTITTNLAAAAAAAGRSVVVVDANFRRPRLAEAMGLQSDLPGLGDRLMDQITTEDAVTATDTGIHVVSAGRPVNRVFERLNNGQFARFMAELRARFDFVIVDAPPAVVAGDALVLANRVDAAVLVVRAYQEQRGLVARLLNQLIDAQCEMLGIVLNRPRGTAGGYFKKNFAAMAQYATQPTAEAEATAKKAKSKSKTKAEAPDTETDTESES